MSEPTITRGASLPWRLLLTILLRLPQGALSRGWGWVAERSLPGFLQRRVNRGFATLVGAAVEEAEFPPEAYASLSRFFVRRLREGVRDWPFDPDLPGSPVDGIVGAHGTYTEGTVLQAKGLPYRVSELLGDDDAGAASEFGSGLYLTLYLSPRHYHRIHAPVQGEIEEARAIPGRLLPVNLPAVSTIEELFPRNERLVALLRNGSRRIAVVAVGAFNVGRISAAFDPEWSATGGGAVTNLRGRPSGEIRRYTPPIRVGRGEEIMAFHLGSTVVLLIEEDAERLPPFAPGIREGEEVRLGAPLLAGSLGA